MGSELKCGVNEKYACGEERVWFVDVAERTEFATRTATE